MDIVNNSAILGMIISAITRPAAELGLVLYLIIVTVMIYSSFGIEYFEDWFHYDPEVGAQIHPST